MHSGAIPPLVVETNLSAFWCYPTTCCGDKGFEWRVVNVNHSVVVLIFLFFLILLVDLQKGLNRLQGRMCDPYVKKKVFSQLYSTILSQKYPTLHCQMYWCVFQTHFDWLAEVWVLSEHLCYLPHYLCLKSLSLSLPVWSLTPQFAYKAMIHTLSSHKHIEWVCPLPSIHISCIWHPWIVVCLVQGFPTFFWPWTASTFQQVIMYPFSIAKGEHVPLKFFMTKYSIMINHRCI